LDGVKIPWILGESPEALQAVALQQSVQVSVWQVSDQMRADQSGFLRHFAVFMD
tara:strand:+ start:23 stop:184 length:162 start_codon:yes stop_codon:yes gene_type:complete